MVFFMKIRNFLNRVYHSKWFPRIFYTKPDGGKDSGVTAFFLIEWKILFSIGILHFKKGSREAYHNHAFNAATWWLKGDVTEVRQFGAVGGMKRGVIDPIFGMRKTRFKPSFKPKVTKRDNMHKVIAHQDSYALTFRGPWSDTWNELRPSGLVTLTHGRHIID